MDNGFKYEEQAPVCTEDGPPELIPYHNTHTNISCRWASPSFEGVHVQP